MKYILTSIFFILNLLIGTSVVFALTPAEIAFRCSDNPFTCSPLLRTEISQLETQQLAPVEFDIALAQIVQALAFQSEISPITASEAIRQIALEVLDLEVAEQVEIIARSIMVDGLFETSALGDDGLTVTARPNFASPN